MNWQSAFQTNPRMSQSFLDSLNGMSLHAAEAAVRKAGHKVYVVPEGAAITLIARPNTVILWNKSSKVTKASAGDPLELR